MHKVFGFFDDSTTEWIPVAVRGYKAYKQYSESVTPMAIATYPEGIRMVHRYVALALRHNYKNEGYVRFLLSAYAAHVARIDEKGRVRAQVIKYFKEANMDKYAYMFSELLDAYSGQESTSSEEGGSEDEQSSL